MLVTPERFRGKILPVGVEKKSAEKQGLLEETWPLLLPCSFPPGQTRRKVLSKPEELPGLPLEQSIPTRDLQTAQAGAPAAAIAS